MADSKETTEFKVDSKVTITMKIDSPPDSAVNSSNEDNDKVQNEKDSEDSSKSSTSSEESNGKNCDLKKESNVSDIPDFKICKPDRKEENTNSTFKLKPSFLRPSQLSSVTNFGSTSILQPVKFQNPFNKASDPVSEENDNDNHKKSATDDVIKEPTVTKKEEIKSEDSKPKFLKLGLGSNENENNVHNTLTASTSTPSFVFGQNLKQRVAVTYDTESSDSSGKEDIKEETTTNENGSSELLFSNAAAVCKSTTKPSLSLSEAAQELEEASRANKRKYNEVTLLTGEEEETNVLQINCKLFAFDKVSGSWQERGRGSLRLNDKDEESRLVARTAGTQRLILNTKIWSGMTCEIAGPKSLRITAMDVQGDIRIFIIQAAPKEVDQLHSLIIQRLKRAQERQPKKLLTEH